MEHDQEDYDIHGGAVGGEELDGVTSVKSVEKGCQKTDAEDNLNDRNTPDDGNMDVKQMNLFFNNDVDLRQESVNNLHGKKCNEQYKQEMALKSKKNAVPNTPMNIPVADSCRKNESEQGQLVMAERQNSFQSLVSGPSEIPAMSDRNGGVEMHNIGNNNALVTSLTGAQLTLELREENQSHMASNLTAISRPTTSCNQTNNRLTNMSSGSRYSSRPRRSITDDTHVTDCPKDLIELISVHLNGKFGRNWENLLSLYGYSYKEIKLFANKDHPEGYFCTMLKDIDEFQDYTIGFLKEDLDRIPKRDTLIHINEWIKEYNESVD